MKFYSKVKKRIKLGFRTPNRFRRNVKHKILQRKCDIMRYNGKEGKLQKI